MIEYLYVIGEDGEDIGELSFEDLLDCMEYCTEEFGVTWLDERVGITADGDLISIHAWEFEGIH